MRLLKHLKNGSWAIMETEHVYILYRCARNIRNKVNTLKLGKILNVFSTREKADRAADNARICNPDDYIAVLKKTIRR